VNSGGIESVRKFSKRHVGAAISGVAIAAGALSLAYGQVDPFAAAAPPPKAQPKAGAPAPAPGSPAAVLAPPAYSSAASGRTGFLGVEQAVGGSYSAAQTRGTVSMLTLRTLPKSVPPLTVPLKASNGRFLKAKPRIAIPTYTLAIIEKGSVRASGMGQGSDIQQRATSISTVLIGVTDEMAAALVEEAKADLVKQLTAAGIDVVPQAELAANKDMSRLRPVGGKAKGINDWEVYGPASAPLYAGHPLASGLAGPGAAIALTDVAYGLNAVILEPYMAIDYEQIGGSGNRTYSGSASASAEVHFRIANGGAIFRYGPSYGKGSGPGGTLQTDGAGTDELFGVMFEISDKSDDPAINNTFARLGLGSMYRQSKYYGVEISPERYQALVRAAYQGLNAAIVSEIQKAKA